MNSRTNHFSSEPLIICPGCGKSCVGEICFKNHLEWSEFYCKYQIDKMKNGLIPTSSKFANILDLLDFTDGRSKNASLQNDFSLEGL